MTKAKTNALDALRTLIAERQQYEQWISSLESKREGTLEQVFDRVKADYQSRLDRVVTDIGGHAEELQLSISTLSSRLVEVARDEDTRREGLQEAELRAAVGEYEPEQWEQLRSEAEKTLEKIAADRGSLDGQLGELRAIQKLSEVGTSGSPIAAPPVVDAPEAMPLEPPVTALSEPRPSGMESEAQPVQTRKEPEIAAKPVQEEVVVPFEPVVASPGSESAASARGPSARTPPGGVSSQRMRSEVIRPDNSKTLKCPQCGTPNYPTEWYCERCTGELATM